MTTPQRSRRDADSLTVRKVSHREALIAYRWLKAREATSLLHRNSLLPRVLTFPDLRTRIHRLPLRFRARPSTPRHRQAQLLNSISSVARIIHPSQMRVLHIRHSQTPTNGIHLHSKPDHLLSALRPITLDRHLLRLRGLKVLLKTINTLDWHNSDLFLSTSLLRSLDSRFHLLILR